MTSPPRSNPFAHLARRPPVEPAAELAAKAAAARETVARAAEFARLTGAVETARLVISAGAKARGEGLDDVPRDALGSPLDPTSVAYGIVMAARKARNGK